MHKLLLGLADANENSIANIFSPPLLDLKKFQVHENYGSIPQKSIIYTSIFTGKFVVILLKAIES